VPSASSRLALASLCALAGCATVAPPLPPPDPARLLGPRRAVAAAAPAASPWGVDPPAAAPHARPVAAAAAPPTRTERYWYWTAVADVASLTLFASGYAASHDSDARYAYLIGASLPASIVHLIYGRPVAAVIAGSVRLVGYFGGAALLDAGLRRHDFLEGFSLVLLGASVISLSVGIGAGLDVTTLARREVPVAGWRRLPVVPTVAPAPDGWQLGAAGAF
jgi:hypothetical protein